MRIHSSYSVRRVSANLCAGEHVQGATRGNRKRMCRGSNAAAADSVSADKHDTGRLYNGMQELFDEYAQRDTNFNSEKKWLF